MNNLEALREEYIRWVRENFGYAGDPGTTEMDNAVADWWLSKFSELEREIENMIGVTYDKKGEVEVDIETGMPVNVYLKKPDVLKLFNREK